MTEPKNWLHFAYEAWDDIMGYTRETPITPLDEERVAKLAEAFNTIHNATLLHALDPHQ